MKSAAIGCMCDTLAAAATTAFKAVAMRRVLAMRVAGRRVDIGR